MSAFNTISLKLKEMYQMITLGGDAELELVDSLDPFSEVWEARVGRLTYTSAIELIELSPMSPILRALSSACGLPARAGRTSQTSLAARRRLAPCPLSLPSITSSPHRCMSWTRSMLRWVSDHTAPLL
jgi:hypothetical protein